MAYYRLGKMAVAVGFFALSTAVAATAAFGDVGELKEQLQENTDITQQDIQAIEPELQEFSQREGDPAQASELVRTSLQNNCVGPCLKEVMRSMNMARAQGLNDGEARELVSNTLRNQVRERSEDLGRSISDTVEQELAARQRPRAPSRSPGGRGTGSGGY